MGRQSLYFLCRLYIFRLKKAVLPWTQTQIHGINQDDFLRFLLKIKEETHPFVRENHGLETSVEAVLSDVLDNPEADAVISHRVVADPDDVAQGPTCSGK